MKNLLLKFVLIVSLLPLSLGCGSESHAEDAHSDSETPSGHSEEEGVVHLDADALKLANLQIEPAVRQAVRGAIEANGVVEPPTSGRVQVTSVAPGKIVRIAVAEGEQVRAGQPLAVLSSPDLARAEAEFRQASSRLKTAESALARQRNLARLGEFGRHELETARIAQSEAERERAEAESDLNEARTRAAEAIAQHRRAMANLDVAKKEFERSELLYRQGAVPRSQFERAEAEHRQAEATLEAAAKGVETAEAGIRSAQSALNATETKAANARTTVTREERVFSGGFLTSREIVEAESAVRIARLEREAASDAIRLLGGRPGGGSSITITSPISGIVANVSASIGESVTPDRAIFQVLNPNTLWVQLNVFPRDIVQLRIGAKVELRAASATGQSFTGSIDYIGHVFDEATRTVKVRCVFDNRSGHLRPGDFITGRILIDHETAEAAIALPEDAVQDLEGRTVVFVAGESEGEFRAAEVDLGPRAGGMVVIANGLNAGDRVVTRGAFTLKAELVKAELGHGH